MCSQYIKKLAGGWSDRHGVKGDFLKELPVAPFPADFDDGAYISLNTAAGCAVISCNFGI